MSIFCDKTEVTFIGGNGGNGAVHFHREKFVSHGGPDGGDGGHGGNIILLADDNINTLADFNAQKKYKAEEGENGQKKNMTGKSGTDMILKVPAGTIIFDAKTNDMICDLKNHDQSFIIAKGGKGGLGNINFKSSIHQVPEFAEFGEEGETREVIMELKLVADVGIIGFPSAGKSTLISVISNSKPKIAAYPFTTLIPNLGVVTLSKWDKSNKDSFVVADIPGLIEGAHEGKGLGDEFLRHISRCEVLVHLIDPTRNTPDDYKIINNELKAFDKNLAQKDQIVCISKVDAVTEEELKEFKKELKKKNKGLKNIFDISSVANIEIKSLVFEMYKHVIEVRNKRAGERAKQAVSSEEVVFKPHLKKDSFEINFRREKLEASSNKMRKIFDVTGQRIEQVAKMTDIEHPEGLERMYHFMHKMGIKAALRKHGAQAGDRIRIAGKTIIMR